MVSDSKKRTLDAFFAPALKKTSPLQTAQDGNDTVQSPLDEKLETFSAHFTYPFPIPNLPKSLNDAIAQLPERPNLKEPKAINNQAHLDLIYYDSFIPRSLSQDLFHFLRSSLPFYRVSYTINRGPVATNIVTPRFTTVFGLDSTSRFDEEGRPVDAATRTQVRREPQYTTIPPRPLPQCLDVLQKVTEKATGRTYNFCLVNYYASGSDSVAYHSDDERFLGENPAIASLSLGAKRDFLLKHKPVDGVQPKGTETMKIPLDSGDLILMRGKTQANWLHSIPKRAGKGANDFGRINITYRRALVKDGTWDERRREMTVWEEKEEVRIHRGPVFKADKQHMPAVDGQMVKEEAQLLTTTEIKTGEDLKSASSLYFMAKKAREGKNGLKPGKDSDSRDVMKVEEAAQSEIVYAEPQLSLMADGGAFLLLDDEAWEEKVRKDIEGEED